MNRFTNANKNSQAQKQQLNTCWCLLLTVIAVFSLYCVYAIDYKGTHQDVIHIITDINHLAQNYTLAEFVNTTKQFGSQLAQDLGQTATVAHFHQYNFTQAMKQIWNCLIDNLISILQKARSLTKKQISSNNTCTEKPLEVVTSSSQSHSMAVAKEQKSCQAEGRDGQCPKVTQRKEQGQQKQVQISIENIQTDGEDQLKEENKEKEEQSYEEPLDTEGQVIV